MEAQPAKTMTPFDDCWFLTGPTASGKTALSLALARQIDAEIISVDSMALFRGLDIGTAKPTIAEQRQIPHHLIDVLDPHEDSSVANYLEQATAAAATIRARGRQALFVGGSPLYLKALFKGLFAGPPADWELRQKLQAWGEQNPGNALHERLASVDPIAADRLHPNDQRRLLRALEVFELTGRPISSWQTQFGDGANALRGRALVLEWPRDELYRRIEMRVDAMFAAGLVEETRHLLAGNMPLSRTARQAVGYREVLAHLEHGVSLDATIALVKTKSRQFAKRQLTWFRSLPQLRPLPMHDSIDATALAAELAGLSQDAC